MSPTRTVPPAKTRRHAEMTSRVIEMTPDLAAEWLEEHNEENRDFYPHWSDYLAGEMDAGRWLETGDTYKLDWNGDLVDGQHRAAAVRKTGHVYKAVLVEGLDPKARLAVDDNRLRKFSDDLAMNGEASGGKQEDLLRKILKWQRDGGFSSRTERVGRMELAYFYPSQKKSVLDAIEISNHFSRIPVRPQVRAFIAWLLQEYAPESAVRRYLSILAIGSQHEEDEVLIRLKDKLQRLADTPRVRGSKEPKTQAAIYYLVTGWNAWVTGRMTNFQMPRGGLQDPYPKPIQVERVPAS